MALTVQTNLKTGQDLPLYWRLNSIEGLPNRNRDGSRPPSTALFRAFLSEKAFKAGKHWVDELTISFVPAYEQDVRAEAYAALQSMDITDQEMAVAQAEVQLAQIEAELTKATEAVARQASPKDNAAGNEVAKAAMAAEMLVAERSNAALALEKARSALAEAQAVRDAFSSGEEA